MSSSSTDAERVPRWRQLNATDLVLAAALLIGGVAALVSVSRMRVGFAAQFGPRRFPAIVGSLLVLSGGLLAAAAWRAPAHRTVDWPARGGAIRILVVLVSIVAYVLSIETMGMPVATFLVVAFEVWYLGDRRWPMPILVGLMSALVVYFVFMQGLGLMLPSGPFED